jgi:hypothetical protein
MIVRGGSQRPQRSDKRPGYQPQALVVAARCVISGVVLAHDIVRITGSKRACARELVARWAALGPVLVVMDRGFPARDLIAVLQEHRIDFVIRWCGTRGMERVAGDHDRGSQYPV